MPYKVVKPVQPELSMFDKLSALWHGKSTTPEEEPAGPQEEPGMIRKYAPHLIRGAGGFLGFTPLTGAAAGAGSEILAEMVERGTFNPLNVDPSRVAAEGAVGAVGGKFVRSLAEAAKLGKVGASAIKGGLLGASGPVVRHTVEHGDPNPMNYPGEVAAGAGLGAATAGTMAKIFGPKNVPLSIDPRTVPNVPPPAPPKVSDIVGDIRQQGRKGAEKSFEDLNAVPEGKHNPYAPNLAHKPALKPGTPEYEAYLKGEFEPLRTGAAPIVHTPTEVIAKHQVLEDTMKRDPGGDIYKKVRGKNVDRSLDEPSLVDLAKLHAEGLATDAKVETAGKKAIEKEMVERTRSDKAREAYILKTATQEARNLNAGDKAVKAEMESRLKAQGNAEKANMADAKERAASLNARDKFVNEKIEQDEAAAAIQRMEEEGMVPQHSITDRYQADILGGKKTGVTRYVKPAPPKDGEGGAEAIVPIAGGSAPVVPPATRQHVATTEYPTKAAAVEAAKGMGVVLDYRSVGKGRWRVVFADEASQPKVGAAPIVKHDPSSPAGKFDSKVEEILKKAGGDVPPTEPPLTPNPVPNGGPKPKGTDNIPAKVEPPLKGSDLKNGRSFTSKAKAEAVAEATGGRVEQYGPRKYRVVLEDDAEAVAEATANATPQTTNDPNAPQVQSDWQKASEKVREAEAKAEAERAARASRLTPEEQGELRSLFTDPGRKLTKEQAARRLWLTKKENGTLEPEISTEPVAHQIEVEPPAAKAAEPEMSVEDFAGALSKEGQKPIAEVPFSLEAQASKPKSVQEDFLSMMNKKMEPPAPEVPAAPPAEAQPATLYKGPQQASGEAYGAIKAAKAAGEKVPEEGRRVAARAAQRISAENAAKGGPDFGELATLRPEDQQRIIAEQVGKFKKGRTNESGFVNVDPLVKTGLALAGGVTGAAIDDDNRARGFLLGAGAGYGAGAGIGKVANAVASGSTLKDAVEPIVSRVPNYIRGGLLSNLFSLGANAGAGPWGANVMGGVEQAAKGMVNADPVQRDIGLKALKAANPVSWAKGYIGSLSEAASKIDDVDDLGRAGQFIDPANPGIGDQLMKAPAVLMLAGDMNTRNNLLEAGMPMSKTRDITLTNEPKRALWKSIANMFKSKSGENDTGQTSTLGAIMMPFKRTAANIMESGTERTPVLGTIINYLGDESLKIPFKEQMVQQGLGASVFALGYGVGKLTPEEQGKFFKVHTYVSNLGGQYSLLANAGYIAGQLARNKNTAPLPAVAQGISRAIIGQEGMPLPTTEPFQKLITPYLKAMNGDPVDKKDFVPDLLIPKVLGWAKDVTEAIQPPTTQRPRMATARPAGQSRYKVVRPRRNE